MFRGSMPALITPFKDGAIDEQAFREAIAAWLSKVDTDTNARWGMRFVWPIKADYRIVYLDEDYSRTIIGRQKRDFVWVMAREPDISESDYAKLLDVVESLGYDVSKVERVPQQW